MGTKLSLLVRRVGPLVSAVLVGLGGPAQAASCVAGSLATYESLGATGCTIGALTISTLVVEDFPGPAAQQIDPGTVLVVPTSNGFTLGSTVASAAASELLGLRFTITAGAASGFSLSGASVALADRSVSPDGALTAILDAGAAGTAIAFDIGVDAQPAASFASTAASAYDLFFELGIDGGSAGSASAGPQLAALSFAIAIPEPRSALLLGLGLLALAANRRRQPPGR
jgi:hypothetical protein